MMVRFPGRRAILPRHLERTSPETAASEAGFYDQSHLSRHFKNVLGMTPGQYMSAAAGQAQATW